MKLKADAEWFISVRKMARYRKGCKNLRKALKVGRKHWSRTS